MNNFEILQYGYQENAITKQDVYDQVVKGKITPEDYKEIINEECEIPLDITKQQKINELWMACNQTIVGGFIYTYDETDYTIGFDSQDQMNLTQTCALLDYITGTITWKVKGELIFLSLTIAEFLEMLLVAKTHKESNMQKYFMLSSQVQLAEDIETVSSIVW